VSNIASKVKASLVKTGSSRVIQSADTKGHWAAATIQTFEKLGVVQGYEDGSFKPNGDITRAEFAAIINRVFDVTGGDKTVDLQDVSYHWAKDSIEKLARAGVLEGYGDGTFQPDRTISRQEMAVIISRIVHLDKVKKTQGSVAFDDIDHSYAKEAIQDETMAGIIDGKAANKFDPTSYSTRAEALKIILNTLNLNANIKMLLESLK